MQMRRNHLSMSFLRSVAGATAKFQAWAPAPRERTPSGAIDPRIQSVSCFDLGLLREQAEGGDGVLLQQRERLDMLAAV
jgi:hypothetical protein